MDLDKLIKKGDWVFAKTYKDFAPHQYLTRDDNQELCRKMDKKLEEESTTKTFIFPTGESEFEYYYYGDWRYWYTNNGFVLNRCPKDQTLDWSKPETVIGEELKGLIPAVTVHHKDEAKNKYATITHNRARGEHKIEPMKNMINNLLDEGRSVEEISKELGMNKEEVFRLSKMDKDDFLEKMIGEKKKYSKAKIILKT